MKTGPSICDKRVKTVVIEHSNDPRFIKFAVLYDAFMHPIGTEDFEGMHRVDQRIRQLKHNGFVQEEVPDSPGMMRFQRRA